MLVCNILKAQNITVEYSSKYNLNSHQELLIVYDSISAWKRISNLMEANSENNQENKIHIKIENKESFLIKDYSKNILYTTEHFFSQITYVQDSLHNMVWELSNEVKNILGEKCNLAKTRFRGRNYFAYYTNNIPLIDGPWKFGGLPGLILEIRSDDNLYEFIAVKIIKNDTQKIYLSDISKYKFVNWQQYTELFIKTIDKVIEVMKTNDTADTNEKTQFKVEMIEIIYPKAQEGKGIEY
jgi:GLPGLI family protein